MQMQQRKLSASALPLGLRRALIAGLAVLSPVALAKAKDGSPREPQSTPQDMIAVVGRIALPAGHITGLAPTRHFSSDYLYAEYNAEEKVTVIDVTKPGQPSVVADLAYPTNGASGSMLAVAGTSALTIGKQPSSGAIAPSTSVKIMTFSDFGRPKVLREFSGVTAIGRDDSRGLIFLADAAGIWVLQELPAEDAAVEAAFAKLVLYGGR
jgi:hypothetical protein